MYKIVLAYAFFLISFNAISQQFQFETVIDLEATEVKDQGHTGTCWSFATSSFLESEIYRINGKHIDVSEMFIVRNTYEKKAWNYVMRQGKIQFSEGGLAHDVINAIADSGIAPQIAFDDVLFDNSVYNHSSIIPSLKKVLDAYIKDDINSKFPDWKSEISPILDQKVGEKIEKFNYNNQNFTPASFREYLKIIPEDYISLTSFTHEGFFNDFVLNIPDNFSNGSFYNVPLDMLVSITDEALKKGFSIALDVDVSEKTFSTKQGIATLPIEKKINKNDLSEIVVTPTLRQKEFENFNTTDDHLMHITGIVKDQNGNSYYKVKNSWGGSSDRVGNNGFIYMSLPYFKLKAISILLHKDALEEKIKRKLKI